MLATAVVIATLVASCGGGTGKSNGAASQNGSGTTEAFQPPTPLQAVQNAIVATRNAHSARYAGTFFFDAGPLGTNDPAAGVIALQDGDAAYVVDMHAETSGLVPAGTPPAQINLHVLDLGKYLYLNFPAAFSSVQGVGNTWVRIPEHSSPLGVTNPPGFQLVSARVFLAARLLRPDTCLEIVEGVTAARVVGQEVVRGKPTTRYSIQWAPRAWVENSGLFFFFGKDRSPARLASLDKVLGQATTADVWIDDLGRIRKVVGSADLTVISRYFDPPAGPGLWRSLRTECDFYDYGAPTGTIGSPSNVYPPSTNP
jgi:hypothetical protein